jgi:hypothetical protein
MGGADRGAKATMDAGADGSAGQASADDEAGSLASFSCPCFRAGHS